ncbi:hypothetical protein ACWEP8_22815 [Streptomyces hydrogenans]
MTPIFSARIGRPGTYQADHGDQELIRRSRVRSLVMNPGEEVRRGLAEPVLTEMLLVVHFSASGVMQGGR